MKLKTIEYLKENKMKFYLCRICGEIVNKSHFNSEEHIKKFNTVCDIEIKKSFKGAFYQSKDNSMILDIIIYTQTRILKNI